MKEKMQSKSSKTTTITTTNRRHTMGGGNPPKITYKEDWWERSPKTDYTYAKSMSYSARQEAGCLSPNMARKALHSRGQSTMLNQSLQEESTQSISAQQHTKASTSQIIKETVQMLGAPTTTNTLNIPAITVNSNTTPQNTKRVYNSRKNVSMVESSPALSGASSNYSTTTYPPSATRAGTAYGGRFSRSNDDASLRLRHDNDRITQQTTVTTTTTEYQQYADRDRVAEKSLEYAGESSPYKEKHITHSYGLSYSDDEDVVDNQCENANITTASDVHLSGWKSRTKKLSTTLMHHTESNVFVQILTWILSTTSVVWNVIVKSTQILYEPVHSVYSNAFTSSSTTTEEHSTTVTSTINASSTSTTPRNGIFGATSAATGLSIVDGSAEAAAAGNIWVTLGTPIHNTVAKVLTLDTWILHKTGVYRRRHGCCWMLLLWLLLPLFLIGAWCACQDEALQERIIYGAGLKSNDTDQFYFQHVMDKIAYLPASVMWLFSGSNKSDKDESSLYQSIVHNTYNSDEMTNSANQQAGYTGGAGYDAMTANQHGGSSGKSGHGGMTAAQLQELIRQAVQIEMNAWTAAHPTEKKEDIDLEAVIRGVVVPMLDERKDADVVSTSDAIHAHSNATYIQIHNEYKTAIEQQNATIEQLVQKLLAEMQEKLKQDLQVELESDVKGYFKDDLQALISEHLSNVDSKLTAMSDSIGTVAVDSEQLQKSAPAIDEDAMIARIQSALLLAMTAKQSEWQESLSADNSALFIQYKTELYSGIHARLQDELNENLSTGMQQIKNEQEAAVTLLASQVKEKDAQPTELVLNAAILKAIDKAAETATNVAVNEAVHNVLGATVNEAVQQSVASFNVGLGTAEGTDEEKDNDEQINVEAIKAEINADFADYKVQLQQTLLDAALGQQNSWQSAWVISSAASQEALLSQIQEDIKESQSLMLAGFAKDHEMLQEQHDGLAMQMDAQKELNAGYDSQVSSIQAEISTLQATADLLSRDLENTKVSINNLNAMRSEDSERASRDVTPTASVDLAALTLLESTIQNLQNDLESLKQNHLLHVDEMKDCCRNDTALMLLIRSALQQMLYGEGSGGGAVFVTPEQLQERINELLIQLSKTQYGGTAGTGGMSQEAVGLMIKEALAIYGADKTGMVDYAMESAGGSVLNTRCSQTYNRRTAELSLFGIPLWYTNHSPRTVIQPDMNPGQCWAFKGAEGYLVLELSGRVKPTAFSVEHIPKALSPTGKIDSAPKDFSVWGLDSPTDVKGIHLGNYTYKESGEPLQYFGVTDPNVASFRIIELRIHSNHGNLEYTCLYRFRVHGKLT